MESATGQSQDELKAGNPYICDICESDCSYYPISVPGGYRCNRCVQDMSFAVSFCQSEANPFPRPKRKSQLRPRNPWRK